LIKDTNAQVCGTPKITIVEKLGATRLQPACFKLKSFLRAFAI